MILDSRIDPRSSYPHYAHDVFLRSHSPWDRLQVGYFLGYALWNYYDADGMQRRMDYSPDVAGNPLVTHYTDDPRTFGGIVVPTRRRVHRRGSAGISDCTITSITMDIHDVDVRRARAPQG